VEFTQNVPRGTALSPLTSGILFHVKQVLTITSPKPLFHVEPCTIKGLNVKGLNVADYLLNSNFACFKCNVPGIAHLANGLNTLSGSLDRSSSTPQNVPRGTIPARNVNELV
jgi:hypothetical protein